MDKWGLVGFVMGSRYRQKILAMLHREGPRTPMQISRSVKSSLSYTSHILSQLKDRGLVECMTPERAKNRLYRITERGEQLVTEMEAERINSQNCRKIQ